MLESQVSEELYRAFQNFHDKYAREPKDNMTKAKRIHHDLMQEIESTFRRNGICHRLEYTGSSYEGVKVRKGIDEDDLEFDVMMVVDKHKYDLQVLEDNDRPGYAWLKINRGEQPSRGLDKVLKYWNFFGFISGDLYVDPNKTIDIFFGELQKLINESYQMKGKVKLRRHGPAVQMDVHPDSGVLLWGPRLFSVDLVPAYEVGSALYVSKPLKGEVPIRMTWRRSFSVQEKQKLSGGAKYVLRALKVVRNRESGLAPLTSYHLKTALFYEMDSEHDWNDRALVLRFLGVLGQLERSLANENLPHYFIREINLLSSVSSSSMRNMCDRIERIRGNENKLMNILKS